MASSPTAPLPRRKKGRWRLHTSVFRAGSCHRCFIRRATTSVGKWRDSIYTPVGLDRVPTDWRVIRPGAAPRRATGSFGRVPARMICSCRSRVIRDAVSRIPSEDCLLVWFVNRDDRLDPATSSPESTATSTRMLLMHFVQLEGVVPCSAPGPAICASPAPSERMERLSFDLPGVFHISPPPGLRRLDCITGSHARPRSPMGWVSSRCPFSAPFQSVV